MACMHRMRLVKKSAVEEEEDEEEEEAEDEEEEEDDEERGEQGRGRIIKNYRIKM